ncbi:TPA: restriction endonuclease subunit S [Klebsiella oxytoca]|nr:restriction endonuclease subunit S [Klebsiella oxytoca]
MTFKTIGDFVELQRGTTYKSSLLGLPGPYLLGLGSIGRDGGFRDEKLKTYGGTSAEKILVHPGDIYVSLKDVTQNGDLLGAVAKVPPSIKVGRLTQDTVKLIFKNKIDENYFYWVLRTPQYRDYCRSHATGTTNLGLAREDFFKFRIPELTVNRSRIATVLNGIEKKIEANLAINSTLESLAQILFKSWFINFEPVKDKIAVLEAGGSQEEATLAAMTAISGKDADSLAVFEREHPEKYAELKATAESFPSAMQNIESIKIPEGWRLVPLSNIASFASGKINVSELTKDTYISTENMLVNKMGIECATSLPSANTTPSFKPEHILISNIRPYFKKIWLARFLGGRSADVLAFEHKKHITSEYLYNILYQDSFFDFMMQTSKGVKMPRGDKKAIMEWSCIEPTIELVSLFSNKVKEFYSYIESHNRENIQLSQFRDTLLPKLFSGEITRPDAKEIAKEADYV